MLLTAPTNAQVNMLLTRVHQECYSDTVFRQRVLGKNPAPWLRLRAQRATAPTGPASFDQHKVLETSGNTPGCKATLKCALNSCRVLFAISWDCCLPAQAAAWEREGATRFAIIFVDEASRHSTSVGLDLAAMGSQCLHAVW